MLRGAGYTSVTSTKDPLEVCKMHGRNHYDLILLDIQMPGIDGFEVMEGLKAIDPHGYLPVLVTTVQPAHKLRALNAGAKDFVAKPFEAAEVLARVHNILEARLLLRRDAKDFGKALEQKIQEVAANRDLIHRQNVEIRRLRERIASLGGGEEAASAQAHLPRDARPRTLLYIEDDPADLKLVEQIMVRRPDMRLLSAANGTSGIEIARASRPDVVLMDINLPDMSGYNALNILRSDPATAHLPVIALSANATQINIESGLEEGFFRYLTKPINVDEFLEVLDSALDFSRQKAGASQ